MKLTFNTHSCKFSLVFALAAFLVTGCAPKIYVIDNQTVLEEQAAGKWPQFEQEILLKSKGKGPAPLSQVPVNARKNRLYNVLNGPIGVTTTAAESKSQQASPLPAQKQ